MNKKRQFNIVNIITGIIFILAGILVIANYVNGGLLIAIIALLIKSFDILLIMLLKAGVF